MLILMMMMMMTVIEYADDQGGITRESSVTH